MSKAIVTGGAGFIGSHIVEKLLQNDFHVVVLDNVPAGNIINLEHLRSNKKMEYIQGTTSDLYLMQSLFSEAEYVFHLAARPYTNDDKENPVSYYEANSNGILNVLQTAKEQKVKKVILASSSAVYGNEQTLPKKETMIPAPSSPYAITKLTAEMYCSIYHVIYNLQTVCLRYFNVYGPRQSPNSPLASVIPKFIQRIAEGKPPIIFGDGNQTRDFVFASDVAAASLLAAESDATGIFNIGSGDNVSLNQVTELILRLMNRVDLKPIYENGRDGEIRHSVADISKAQVMGYKPQYTLEEGLKETIERGMSHH
jgi:UDP-glucose 4-epimerase